MNRITEGEKIGAYSAYNLYAYSAYNLIEDITWGN